LTKHASQVFGVFWINSAPRRVFAAPSLMTAYTPLHDEPEEPQLLLDAPADTLERIDEMKAGPAAAAAAAELLRADLAKVKSNLNALRHYSRWGCETQRRECKTLMVESYAMAARLQAKVKADTGRDVVERTCGEYLIVRGYRVLMMTTVGLILAGVLQLVAYLYEWSWMLPSKAIWAPAAVVSALWWATFLVYKRYTVRLRGFALSSRKKDEELTQLLSEGVIRLLDCDWLLNGNVEVLNRRQERPENAFLTRERAAEVWAERERLVGVQTYRWLTAGNPDPHGVNLADMRRFLATAPAVRPPLSGHRSPALCKSCCASCAAPSRLH